ncbi:MAG TPA: polysaccharide biosynthesis tyrosine autokinase [Candidatus Marinimicrobia bacterium]|nr:polysaccharide biosynthesis tyrosine autokinase [Candidatus Neomarinimicrobiota bacterium]HRS51476.1 polysaccharide biosynthesis tyrosine autokinase [Candidatus Neomarinimicrobiota bacterium]HRU92746.1 polysaccharide biosynthesis tyrosine autokinase [Candidatus Neomarinimicrobiota bacterium]
MARYELNLRDYWRIIKKRKIIVIVTLILLTCFSLIFAIMNRPTPLYRATASLKIEKSTNLTGLYMYSISWGTGDDLATRAEEIKSYPMIEKAAQKMGLIDSSLTSEQIRSNKGYLDIVAKLKSRVKTEQEGYTNIINIIVTDYDPVLSANLANALAQVYEVESFNEKNLQAQKALEAVRNQRAMAEQALRISEQKVQNYREQNKLATLGGAASRLTSELNSAETNLEKIRGDIHQIDNILREIENNREYIYLANLSLLLSQPNRFLEDLQTQLNQIRSQITNYSQYYTPQHPSIIELQQQLKNTENRFVSELKSFRQNLARAETIAEEKYNRLSEEYKSLPLIELTLSNLERERDVNTQIYQQLEIRYQEAIIRYSEQVKEVFIIRPAFVPTSPINQATIGPTTAIGMIIGLILGIVLAFVAETLDTTFNTVDDIKEALDTNIMGIIPFVDFQALKSQLAEKAETPIPDEVLDMQAKLVSYYSPKSSIAESLRGLRTNVHFALLDKGYKTLMVTSSIYNEGKTSIAANLAISMAQIGINTLLVDADLRKPRISKLFGIDREPGLTDVILRKEPIDNVIRTMSDLMVGTMAADVLRTDGIAGIEYLNILTSGKIERNPAEIVASKLMDNLIAELKKRYDLVIFDTSPLIPATDSTILGTKVDTVLLVYYQGKISRGTLRRSKNQMELLKTDILGVVVNGMKAEVSADYADYKYGYEYHYQEETPKPKNKVLTALESFFLKPAVGMTTGFFNQLNILRAGLAIITLGLVIGGGIWAFTKHQGKKVKSQVQVEGKATETILPQTTSLTDTSVASVIPTTDTLTHFTEQTASAIPPQLKQLQEQYGIETAPQQQVAQNLASIDQNTITPPAPVQSVAPPVTQSNKPDEPPINVVYSSATSSKIAPTVSVRQLPSSFPYTLVIEQSFDKSKLINQLNTLRRNGLAAFITTDFSDPKQKNYILCYGSFSSETEAINKSKELQFLGFQGTFRTVKLPFSILLDDFSTFQSAQQAIEHFASIKDYLYIQPSSQKPDVKKTYYLLFGGFPDIETAELVMNSYPDLSHKTVVKR